MRAVVAEPHNSSIYLRIRNDCGSTAKRPVLPPADHPPPVDRAQSRADDGTLTGAGLPFLNHEFFGITAGLQK
jgi:hypothetical protein